MRIARDPAKVEDQVRFLARTLDDKALEPDGTAAACKAVSSGFDSHRRFFESNDTAGPTAHAALSSNEAVGDVCSVNGV